MYVEQPKDLADGSVAREVLDVVKEKLGEKHVETALMWRREIERVTVSYTRIWIEALDEASRYWNNPSDHPKMLKVLDSVQHIVNRVNLFIMLSLFLKTFFS